MFVLIVFFTKTFNTKRKIQFFLVVLTFQTIPNFKSTPCSARLPCPRQLDPTLIKSVCEVSLPPLAFLTPQHYLSDTSPGWDPAERKGSFLFFGERATGIFDGRLDPAHLRALWWNNSKCLSCIVWHVAGGVLKPLLPLPKAPLNKIVKNNSFTLIFHLRWLHLGREISSRPVYHPPLQLSSTLWL